MKWPQVICSSWPSAVFSSCHLYDSHGTKRRESPPLEIVRRFYPVTSLFALPHSITLHHDCSLWLLGSCSSPAQSLGSKAPVTSSEASWSHHRPHDPASRVWVILSVVFHCHIFSSFSVWISGLCARPRAFWAWISPLISYSYKEHSVWPMIEHSIMVVNFEEDITLFNVQILKWLLRCQKDYSHIFHIDP